MMHSYKRKEVSLKVYGKRSWEVLHVLSRFISKHLCRRGAVYSLQIQMRTSGEVYGIYDQSRHKVKDVAANFGYHVKEALGFLTGGKVNGENFREHLNEKVSFDCKEYDTRHVDFGKIMRIDTTVGYLRCLYEILIGRDESKIIKTYGRELYEEVKGAPSDCFVSAQKEIYIQELDKLKKCQAKRLENINNECSREMDQVREKFRLMRAENDKLEKKELNDLQEKFGEDLVNEMEKTLHIRLRDY